MPMQKVNNIDLYYEEQGQGEPLVLISGYSADHTSWTHLVPAFSRKFRTIVLDNRGVGQTVAGEAPFTIEDMAADVAGLLEALGIEKAYVMGVSMGGRIAQALALNHPRRVKGLVLCSTAASGSPRSKFALNLLAEEYAKGHITYEFHMAMLQTWTFSERLFAHPEMIKRMLAGVSANRSRPAPENMLRQLQSGSKFDTTPRLGEIRAPTLVIHGGEDILFPVRCGRELAEGIPGARFVLLEGGAHGAYLEMADKFVPAVLGFLAELDARRG